MVASDEEKEWIIRSRKGDREAFEALIRAYQKMIYSLCYRMSGSPDDADDLVQETFIQAYQRLDGFRSEAKFSSWLYRIAMNHCLNWRSREARRERAYENWEPQSASMICHEAGQQVQNALMKLPAKQRAAVVLTVYEGLNHFEAAKALGCTEATISWRVFTARTKLKKWLQPYVRQHGQS